MSLRNIFFKNKLTYKIYLYYNLYIRHTGYKKKASYSQWGEDHFIQNFFKNKDTGVYLDVGCFHPFKYSNTCLLYNKGWKGINIDVVLEDKKLHSIFEEYSWKERQTKFIINSVRCYEFYGYKYLVPLWDKDLASFFRKVNLKHKNRNSTIKFGRETNLYDKVSKGYFIEYNIDFNRNSFKNIIQRILCKLLQICKNKDCLNYHHQIKILDKTSKPYVHINNAVIKNTLRNLELQ